MRRSFTSLTAHELEILRLYARGVRGQRLAQRLGISYHTVRSHYTRICQKVAAPDMLAAAVRLVEDGQADLISALRDTL